MAIAWYGNQTGDEGCKLGSLAVVWPLLERMNVAGIIDRHLPVDPQAEFSHGMTLSLLVATPSRRQPQKLAARERWVGGRGRSAGKDTPPASPAEATGEFTAIVERLSR